MRKFCTRKDVKILVLFKVTLTRPSSDVRASFLVHHHYSTVVEKIIMIIQALLK